MAERKEREFVRRRLRGAGSAAEIRQKVKQNLRDSFVLVSSRFNQEHILLSLTDL